MRVSITKSHQDLQKDINRKGITEPFFKKKKNRALTNQKIKAWNQLPDSNSQRNPNNIKYDKIIEHHESYDELIADFNVIVIKPNICQISSPTKWAN